MAIENSIIFGGVNSADFGIYISGEGVFNAPKRDVEMITIPGRNGEFALDQGRFENITVTYPAFNFEPNDYDTFAQNLSDFRNAICSQKGYQRLTDTFHPDEYRMAAYTEGLEVKPIKYNTASQFNITFDCKPQRFLTSGEETTTMPGKNLIPYPYYNSSGQTDAGITFTVKNDGTIVMNGTASASPYFRCVNNTQDPYLSSGTEYIMSQTTNTDKSLVVIYFFDVNHATITIPCSITYDDGTIVNANRSSISLNYGGINHKWCKFSFTSSDPVYTATGVRLLANAGTVTDATVQPMIRLASDPDPNYVRYNGIYNPTLFEASPMLEVTGYGNIGINDESIVLADVPLGEIKIGEAVPASQMTLDMTNVLTGDTIYQRVDGGVYEVTMHCVSSSASLNLQVTGYTDVASVVVSGNYSSTVKLTMKPAPFEGVAGTLKQSSSSVDLSFKITNGGTTTTTTGRFWVLQSYDGNNGFYAASGETDFPARSVLTLTKRSSISSVYAFSTVSVANYYIDLDIGEAYGKIDDEYYSLNSTVEFPSKLPTLKAGTNTITYDNTITDFKIVPRWWKI